MTTVQKLVEDAYQKALNIQVLINNGSRRIKIGDYPSVGCGGTHVGNTRELSGLKILKIKKKKGKIRVSYEV